ncbi:MAG: hypothetical protein UY35_C0006G0013 [Candidatus Saccharibacteria bacterium GW2011_GWC2_48_9]|nr:MAG: hypothetical protein UY35_C0006G0013 [Candidatus Saccharibacteria bacterium GW2011_GWC2_48_9]HCH34278.1 hypothetical protein [Candidatus Saccharibacteria bacterium]
MLTLLLHTLWRLLILGIGGTIIWLMVFELVPYVNQRVPIFFIVLLGYCAVAYGMIPSLFRLYHVIVKHDHIPLYVTTSDGWASDPVNLALIVKDKNHLLKVMKKAGWYEADPLTLKNAIREVWSILFNTSYPEAPVSNLYLFNRPHELAFQIPTNDQLSARTRHHVRFWRLEAPVDDRKDHNHFDFWSEKLFKWLHLEKEIWIGACTEEFRAIDFQWRTGRFTHAGSHESDKERDFVIQTLTDTRKVRSVHTSDPGEELRFRGQQFRTFYISDSSLKIAELK